MLTSPLFLITSTLATMWAALFHLLLGKRLIDLVLYWFVGLIGFAVGQAMADVLALEWLQVGQVHLIEGTLGCWIAMLVARWLKV
ncbi:MAG TPA: hypothetical protein GX702_15880 [Chloroflexi bacterium]|jgi:hypothetical protein|nr:hypothetical protein [Chloroflexota bacterium]